MSYEKGHSEENMPGKIEIASIQYCFENFLPKDQKRRFFCLNNSLVYDEHRQC